VLVDDEADLDQTRVVRQDHSPRHIYPVFAVGRFERQIYSSAFLMKPRIQEGIHEYAALDERSTVFGRSIP
jgi:hypothetical protein